jgi:hypothetical protein
VGSRSECHGRILEQFQGASGDVQLHTALAVCLSLTAACSLPVSSADFAVYYLLILSQATAETIDSQGW